MLVFVSLLSARADAAPSWQERREASALVAEAKKLVTKGDLKAAIGKLKKADKLDPQLSTALELAKLQRDLGNYVESLVTLRAIEKATPKGYQEKRIHTEAGKLLVELERKTPSVTIELFKPRASKVTLLLDDEDVEAGEHELNPGKHELVATAKGYDEFRKTIRLDERDHKTVEVSMRKTVSEESDEAGASTGGVPKWAAWTSWGVTAAAVGVGAGFGIMAIQTTNQVLVDYGCENGKCPTSAAGDLDIAKFNGNVSTAAFAIGGVGLVTASVLTAMAYKKPEAPKQVDDGEGEATIEARPLIGPGFVGVVGTF